MSDSAQACLVLYKIFLKFPDALRPSFPRLKEKLEDPESCKQPFFPSLSFLMYCFSRHLRCRECYL